MGDIDFGAFDALTFDCYGTLIDWETGILSALRPVLERTARAATTSTLLELFAHHEAALEAGPYLRYREVLAGALRGIGTDLELRADPSRAGDASASRSSTGRRSRTARAALAALKRASSSA